MRCYACTFEQVIIRFYLMMACVIAGLFAGQPLIALLALPLFLSAILGIRFTPAKRSDKDAEIITMNTDLRTTKKVA